MSFTRLLCLCSILSLSLVAAGCGGGGDGGSGRSSRGRFSFGRKSKDKDVAAKSSKGRKDAPRNRKASADLDDISPEKSMQRDLERLREKEKAQVRTVEEMRTALAQGESMVVKEEQKLREIRRQIEDYDVGLRRYEQASARRSHDGDDFAAPANMYGGRNENHFATRNNNNNNGGYDPYYDDRRQPGRNIAPVNYSQPQGRGEEVLYSQNSRGGNDYPPQPQGRRSVYDRQPIPPPQASARRPAPAPAPQPRAQQRPPAPAPLEDEEDLWNPGANLYSRNSIAPRPQPSANSVKPTASTAPAPKKSVAPPAAGNAGVGVTGGTSRYDNEVFTPDLYLSGGR